MAIDIARTTIPHHIRRPPGVFVEYLDHAATRFTASARSLGKETVSDFSIVTRIPPHDFILAELTDSVYVKTGPRLGETPYYSAVYRNPSVRYDSLVGIVLPLRQASHRTRAGNLYATALFEARTATESRDALCGLIESRWYMCRQPTGVGL